MSVVGVLAFLALFLGFAQGVFEALEPRIRFSRLLRRRSDPRTATVTASKRGGRTLILDIPRDGTGRGYQSLSEVRLALRTKAGMLMPGETVNVYGGSDDASELLNQQPPVGQGVPRHGKKPVGPPTQTARREGERCHSRRLGRVGGVDDIFIHRFGVWL